MRGLARQVSRDVLPPFCVLQKPLPRMSFDRLSEDRDRNYTIFMLLFKNLQERTLISCPSNLVYCFAILILGNTFLIPNTDVPCCDQILIQLAGTERTHYSATDDLTSITPAPKKGAQSFFQTHCSVQTTNFSLIIN